MWRRDTGAAVAVVEADLERHGNADIVNGVSPGRVEHEQHAVVRAEVGPLPRSPCTRSSCVVGDHDVPAPCRRRASCALGATRERRVPRRASRARSGGVDRRRAHRAAVSSSIDGANQTTTTHDAEPPRPTARAVDAPSASRAHAERGYAACVRARSRAARWSSIRSASATSSAAWYVSSLEGNMPSRTSVGEPRDRGDRVGVPGSRSGARTSGGGSPASPSRSWYTSTWPSQ